MKRFLLVIALLGVIPASYSQGDLRLGVNAGIPIGDAADISTLNVGADVAYLMGFGDILQIGPMVGYNHFFGENDNDDIQFLPVAATARVGLASLELGADVGYALGIDQDIDGGFYYRPKIGFGFFGLGFIASYTGISVDNGTFSSLNLGVEFRL